MRNKICQVLIKELKGTKVTQELEWAMCSLGLMWQTQLTDKGGVNSNLFLLVNQASENIFLSSLSLIHI